MKETELLKLDDIDRRCVIWCCNNLAEAVTHVLEMYEGDYKKRGIILDVSKMLTELRHHVK